MNSFYYRYFLSRKGLVFDVPDEEWDDGCLDFLGKDKSYASEVADKLGISSLWLTDMPVIFSRKAFNYYIGSKLLSHMVKPEEEGLTLIEPSQKLKDGLRAVEMSAVGFEPMPTSLIPRPYSMAFLAAEKDEISLEKYLRSKLGYNGEAFTDIYKKMLMCSAYPPVGSPLICERDVLGKIAISEGLTFDEASSVFYVADQACLFNLLLAYKMFVEPWHLAPRRDGKYIITYRGYDYGDFLPIGVKASQNRPAESKHPSARRRAEGGSR